MADAEAKHEYLVLKKANSINTQPSRESVPDGDFAWIENLMPIGDAFIQAVPQVGQPIATATASIMSMHPATLGTVNYQIIFTSAGGAQAVNLGNSSAVTIANGGTFTAPAMDQWKSERIVIVDPSAGFFSWDGTTLYSPGSIATVSVIATGLGYTAAPVVGFSGGGGSGATATASISGGGVSSVTLVGIGSGYTSAPSVTFTGGTTSTVTASATAYIMPNGLNGQTVAVYSGRVWVGNNRTLTFTAPGTWFDVNLADAAGSSTITEASLRTRIYALETLDNYLYVFGDSSIIIIGDLKVSGSITTFSQTFLSSTTGTTLPASITALERAILFMNKYGVYALFGASVQKVSKALDGIFPLIDFTQNVSAGLAQIYNILCYVVSFTYQDTNGNRPIQAAFFDGKWFLTSQGANLMFVSPASVNGVLSVWGTSSTDVSQLYSDTTATIATTLVTGLQDAGNPIFDKQVITSGIEYTAPAQSSVTLQVDTESVSASNVSTSGNTLVWTNASGNTLNWVNNANNAITWVATGFLLDYFPTDLKGKYLGATVRSNSPGVVINGILMEYVQRAPWGN